MRDFHPASLSTTSGPRVRSAGPNVRPCAAYAKYFEKACRHRFAQCAAWVAAAGQRVRHPLPSRDAVEASALLVEHFHVAIAGENLGVPVVAGFPNGRQSRRIAEGQRTQQHPVNQAEDQRIRADAQSHQQNGDGGETGVIA
jgi:hypothetical protein